MRNWSIRVSVVTAGLLALAAALPGAALASTAAAAAESASAAPATAETGLALEEVVVTAQKREERLQDVPISITAITSVELEKRHIQNLDDINALAPNVMSRANPGSNLISTIGIRGSVQGQPAIWSDPPVGVYLDGVYLGKQQGQVTDLVDLERVEVLRGPQGTLFGRNTEGGAISFISRKPSGEFGGVVSVEAGQYDHLMGKLSLDLPKFWVVSSTLTVRKEHQSGWARNLAGPALGAVDHDGARVALKFDFSDQFKANYAFDYSNADDTPNPTSLLALNGWNGTPPQYFSYAYYAPTYAGLLAFGLPPAQAAYVAYNGAGALPGYGKIGAMAGAGIAAALTPFCCATTRPGTVAEGSPDGPIFQKARNTSNMLTLDYSVNDNNRFKYIFGRRQLHFSDEQSLSGGTPQLNAFYRRDTHYTQSSHELQYVGNAAGGLGLLKWVGGLYYFHDEGNTDGPQDFSLLGARPTDDAYASETKSKAAFAQLDYTFLKAWTLTGGVRYTDEEKSGWTHRFLTTGFAGPLLCDVPAAACPGVIPFTAYDASFKSTTPMGALAYRINDNVNTYVRVAKGFKSGGFSSELTDPVAVKRPYLPETSLLTEVGVKSEFWDRRAQVNAAYFHTKITNQQTTTLLPGTTQSYISNASDSTYQGFEIEAALRLTEGWKLQLNYGYLDARFNHYPVNPIVQVACPVSVPACAFGGLYTNDSSRTVDAASNIEPGYAPRNTVSANLDGRLLKTGNGELRLILDWAYTDKTLLYAANKNLNAANAGGQYLVSLDQMPAITNLNVRLLFGGVQVPGGSADFSLLVRNATDFNKPVQGIDFGFYRTANWEDPRTWMLTATYRFGAR
ncbi:MAG: TonB-dependent receptor [Proteobacteria bacterium]|nr:TonB-dependent receptor [Pseudomonadota bacterium]